VTGGGKFRIFSALAPGRPGRKENFHQMSIPEAADRPLVEPSNLLAMGIGEQQ
jgi:hypothetical protein